MKLILKKINKISEVKKYGVLNDKVGRSQPKSDCGVNCYKFHRIHIWNFTTEKE